MQLNDNRVFVVGSLIQSGQQTIDVMWIMIFKCKLGIEKARGGRRNNYMYRGCARERHAAKYVNG